jgi:integrase
MGFRPHLEQSNTIAGKPLGKSTMRSVLATLREFLLCLTGVRVAALVSLKIKHVDLQEQSVTQNPRKIATKFGKVIDTSFAKEFDEAETALGDWMTYFDEVALYGPDDPLFPATSIAAKSNLGLEASGFTRRHWKSTEPMRKIVRAAFEAAGVPNYDPHAFRHMLARHETGFGKYRYVTLSRTDQPNQDAALWHIRANRGWNAAK